MDLLIRKAIRGDREAMLNMAADIFHGQSGEWLADRSWFRLAPEAFDPDGYWIVTSQGEIVGISAFRNFMLRMPYVNLPWVGVGTVCTKAEWRGRGVMGMMLRRGIQDTDERGMPISILWGDRMRYGRFGWERAGRQIDLLLSRRYFPDPGWDDRDVFKLVGEGRHTVVEDGIGERLYSIRTTYDNREPRPIKEQLGLLSRPGYVTYIAKRDQKEAYVVATTASAGEGRLLEAVGSPELVADLIGYVLRDGKGRLRTSIVSVDLSDAERMLVDRSNTVSVAPTGMVRIHDLAGLLKHYETWWAKRHVRVSNGAVVLAMLGEDGVEEQTVAIEWSPSFVKVIPLKAGQRPLGYHVVEADRPVITSLVFGPLPIEQILHTNPQGWSLKEIFPLPLHVPHLEKV